MAVAPYGARWRRPGRGGAGRAGVRPGVAVTGGGLRPALAAGHPPYLGFCTVRERVREKREREKREREIGERVLGKRESKLI